MADKSGASPQAVALPTGGGAVRGLGESFEADLNSGTGNYRVPLDLPPGVRNLQPPLSLVYSTGVGNGPLGLGWVLAQGAVSRRTFRGVPAYDDERDTFLYNGTTELARTAGGGFRALTEHAFERFERSGDQWQVTDKSGVRHSFGATDASRVIFDDAGTARVFAWLLDRTEDPWGNTITYHYRKDGAQAYLEEVRYAAYAVRLAYEPRPDVVTDFHAGFELHTALRCTGIDLIAVPAGPEPVRSWRFGYAQAPYSGTSMLAAITLRGHDVSGAVTTTLPPLELTYSGFEPERRRCRRFSAAGVAPPGLGDGLAELVDLDGVGLPGMVRIENGAARYWPNGGGLRWEAPRPLPRFPVPLSLAEDRVRMADMNGDGSVDVLVGAGPFSAYYENGGRAWDQVVRYARSPELLPDEADLHLMDIDGDGVIDAVHAGRTGLRVYRNRGRAGWDPPALVPLDGPSPPPPLDGRDPRIRLADLNGDGLLDIVHLASGRVEYWPARGNGRFGAGRVMASPPRFPYPFDPGRVLLADINGDGLADIVYVGYDEVTFWVNRSGQGFSAPQTVRLTPLTPGMAAVRAVDMTGAGVTGLLWTGPSPDHRYLQFTGEPKPGLLTRVDNHLGQVIEIGYTTSAAQALADRRPDGTDGVARPWASVLPFSLPVVASVTMRDTVRGSAVETRYRYHDGHYDGHRREFDGFGRAEQIETGDASQPSARTVFHFHTEQSARAAEPDPELRRSLKRKTHRIEVYGLDGSAAEQVPYRVEQSRWAVRVEESLPDGRRVVFPHVAETVTTVSERSASARVERRLYSYDAAGNVVREDRVGQGGAAPGLFTRTDVSYAENRPAWVLDRVARIVMRDAAGTILGETRHHYDGAPFEGLPLGQVVRGHLARTERVAISAADAAALYGAQGPDLAALGHFLSTDADGNPVWVVRHERRAADGRGNIVAKMSPLGAVTGFVFSDDGLFPTSVTEPNGRAATIEHDVRVGRPSRLVDANGAVTSVTYDPLGRVLSIASPGDTQAQPTVAFTYDTTVRPARRHTRQRITAGAPATLSVVEYLDGAGEVHQRRTQHDSALFVVSGQEVRNARGKTARKSAPFHEPGEDYSAYPGGFPAAMEIDYDALGRPSCTRLPTGGESRVEHQPFRAVFHEAGDADPAAPSFGTPRVEHYDAWQRLVAVEDGPATARQVTRYDLDGLGRLRRVTDARGTPLTTLRQDLLGRRVSIAHADAGLRLLAYDASGNLAWTRDAAGQEVTNEYDGLERLLRVRHGGVVVEDHTYDTGAGLNLAGRLAHVTDQAGEVGYSYDARGNVVERTRTVPGEAAPFVTRFAYDRLGRVTTVTYPDGHAVGHDYGSGFLVRRLPGYVDDIDYSPTGVRTAVAYANGVRTEYGYDATTSRLSSIRTWHPQSGQVHHHTAYTLSVGGNVTAMDDLRAAPPPGSPGRTQRFGYDSFDRLVRAEGTADGGAYTHEHSYDAVGNMLRNPLVSPHPLVHAPNTNQLVGYDDGGGTTVLFGHDANGNLTSMPGRTLAFNPRGQLESVTLADDTVVHYTYDHQGFLARKRVVPPSGPARRVLYFEHGFELDGADAVRMVQAGGLLVAIDRGGQRLFAHGDHLDSTVVLTTTGGGVASELAYFPFGAIAAAAGAPGTPTFARRRHDPDTGLYYFQARWYAADLGRFVSPDPLYLLHPERGFQQPQRLNPYAYAGNNPLRFTDPNGLGFWDVLGAIAIVIVIAAAVVVTAGLAGAAIAGIGLGSALAYAGAAGLAGAVIGAIAGGIAYGSWQGALTGAMIGFTAGANAMLGGMIFGPVVGGILGVLNLLALIPPVARNDVFQGFLGWSSYLMPMSWPGHALGLLLFVANVVPYLVTFGQVDAVRIRDLRVDWKTGNIFTVGGWIGQMPARAFNFGAFTFVNTSRYIGGEIAPATFEHESGHMLNNAVFGFFQAARVFEGDGLNSYWERLAESNVPPGLRGLDPTEPEPDRPKIPLWSS
ncbi:toxin TcdB middle/N-terminal domain-containing protein [Nonomuraea sp. NPDC050643]|uniref:toxin TcdB middle/N-terminal domain-containing protein n=1 Tax=Nonomuraea sp. NPDC050643 TaxID=3155660 RepID=UPI0033E9457B